jgi:ribosome-associated protein
MPGKKETKSDLAVLTETIVNGIKEKKGEHIVSMDLKKLVNAVCDCFIICHGNSRVQVEAIADSVEEQVIRKLGRKPWHKEGFQNAEWILLDYVDVVVHIFQNQTRNFYNLETLWADADFRHHPDVN